MGIFDVFIDSAKDLVDTVRMKELAEAALDALLGGKK